MQSNTIQSKLDYYLEKYPDSKITLAEFRDDFCEEFEENESNCCNSCCNQCYFNL